MNDSIRLCTVEGCGRKHKGRGYCMMHLQRLRLHGSLELPARQPKPCSVEGCSLPYRCSGFCGMHYSRKRNSGTAGTAERILSPANLPCEREGCDRPSHSRGVCQFHHTRDQILVEVATNPDRRINSWATTEERLRRVGWAEVVRVPALGACWEWAGLLDPKGYGRVAVKGRKMRGAHRESYGVWVGPLTDDELVCHRCDNPPCMNPAHLFLGDQLDNMGDAAMKDRISHGEAHYGHKLTEAQVIEIRSMYAAGRYSQKEIGRQYGVSQSSVSLLVRGKNWARVQ